VENMKYILITSGYPSKDNLYNRAFIHSRVLNYIENGLDIEIFVIKKNMSNNYVYEGVKVSEGTVNELIQKLAQNDYHKILIHFADYRYMNVIMKNRKKSNIIIWVHGVEALGWYRRLFTFNWKRPLAFVKYIIINTLQLRMMRNLILNYQDVIKFVFVSEWMKNILETDTYTKGKISNYAIIPNIVDENIFRYEEKQQDMRYRILSIRPYSSKKYANDISAKAVIELSKRENFKKYNFEFYGDGKLFEKTLKPLRKFENVKIYKKFLNQKEIAVKHKENGIFLVPTRQDAQGVSMCEAMSSGLIPITSNNTAIPEFVNEKTGFLTKNYVEIANAIEEITNNIELFKEMSKEAAQQIIQKCGKNATIKKEIEIITKV